MNPPRINRQHLPFTLDAGLSARAAIGLIVLATDNTIEHEWRQIFRLPGVALYQSRLMNSAEIVPETLREMERDIGPATDLIRPGRTPDVIAFGCTSGAMVIGEEAVFTRIRSVLPDARCTTPITAARHAMEALGVRRIALLTPYVDEINQWMRRYITAWGVEIPVMGSFNNENDQEVARFDTGSVEAAILALGAEPDVDAVFVSCTSVRVVEQVEALEQRLGKPVTSSNHAMAWHALRLAGIEDRLPGFGRLFRL